MRVLRQCLRFALYLEGRAALASCPVGFVPYIRRPRASDTRGSPSINGVSLCFLQLVTTGSPLVGNSGGLAREIVPNGVVGPEADPVGDRPVLLLGLRKLLLGTERLVALYPRKILVSDLLLQAFLPRKIDALPVAAHRTPLHRAARAPFTRRPRRRGIDGTASRCKIRRFKRDWTYRHLDGLGLTDWRVGKR